MSGFAAPAAVCGIWCISVYELWVDYGLVAAIPAAIAGAISIAVPLSRRQITEFVRRHKSHA